MPTHALVLRAWLLVCCPLPLALAPWLAPQLPWGFGLGVGIAAGVALLAGAVFWQAWPTLSRSLVSLGHALTLGCIAFEVQWSPPRVLSTLLLSLVFQAAVWVDRHKPIKGVREHLSSGSRQRLSAGLTAASVAALTTWPMVTRFTSGSEGPTRVAITASLCLANGLLLLYALSARKRRRRLAPLSVLVQLVCGASALTIAAPGESQEFWLAVPLWFGVALGIADTPRKGALRQWTDAIVDRPVPLVLLSFLGLCLLGSYLLALPLSNVSPHGMRWLDAGFTAVSAVCVTGLSVLDVHQTLSPFGQGVLLLLIQVGGLSIMSFSTFVLTSLGERVSLKHEAAVAQILSDGAPHRLQHVSKRVLTVTLGSELLGAALLSWRFSEHGDEWGMALWRGVFTSVSAFCNAGFSLQSDSLVGYGSDPFTLHVVALLIIAGGLSPAVVTALPRFFTRRGIPLPVETRVVAWTSAALLLIGFVGFLSFEWHHALSTLSPWDKIHNAWFHSTTTRTAGFNSFSLEALSDAGVTLTMVLMLIGGSPGGTAGGLKTTTFAVLCIGAKQALGGKATPEVWGRRIGTATINRAVAVSALSGGIFLVLLLAFQVTQTHGATISAFEVLSALATVGLSLGATPNLDAPGQLLIMAAMFLGRVGPLVLFAYLSVRGLRGEGWARASVDLTMN